MNIPDVESTQKLVYYNFIVSSVELLTIVLNEHKKRSSEGSDSKFLSTYDKITLNLNRWKQREDITKFPINNFWGKGGFNLVIVCNERNIEQLKHLEPLLIKGSKFVTYKPVKV